MKGIILSHELLENLNPMQRIAVECTEGPQLIIAGAGSGKTRVITHKIAYLIKVKHVAPWRIFASTFTNKAANEMKERVIKTLDLPGEVRLNISTFHSLCARFLRKEAHKVDLNPHFTIIDDRDQKALLKDCLKIMNIEKEDFSPKQAREMISMAKSNLCEPENLIEEIPGMVPDYFPELYKMYQKRLVKSDAADFDDLILYMTRLLQNDPETRRFYQERFQYILVDEYQDTNLLQYEFIRILAGDHGNLCVVGDEDQSIYSWRGAKISNLLDFSKHFKGTKLIKLEQNYRSTKSILRAADAVISKNLERIGKTLWTDRPEGDPVFLIKAMDEKDEAKIVIETMLSIHHLAGIPLKEMAIFYRQNSLSRPFEDEIRRRKVPYRIVGGMRFYDRAEIKDMLAYLKVAVNPNNSISLQRIINVPARGIGAKTVQKLILLGGEKNLTLFQTLGYAVKEKILPSRANNKVAEFLEYLKKWHRDHENMPAFDLFRMILEESGYIKALDDLKNLEALSRRENILELQNAIQEFFEMTPGATLENYFETLSLTSPVDELQSKDDFISMMTLHCAKGLEFNTVFLVGLEDPIFPSRRTVEETGNLEEERRLFYVGITRAKDRLFLTNADSRMRYGSRDWNLPSIFLNEIPMEYTRRWDARRYNWHIEDSDTLTGGGRF
jgi:ATP-dependent DNA helicase UvrD/PcrA